jgi:hypothetical protein
MGSCCQIICRLLKSPLLMPVNQNNGSNITGSVAILVKSEYYEENSRISGHENDGQADKYDQIPGNILDNSR